MTAYKLNLLSLSLLILFLFFANFVSKWKIAQGMGAKNCPGRKRNSQYVCQS